VWAYGGVKEVGMNSWSVFWFFPLLMPLGTVGRMRWKDSNAE